MLVAARMYVRCFISARFVLFTRQLVSDCNVLVVPSVLLSCCLFFFFFFFPVFCLFFVVFLLSLLVVSFSRLSPCCLFTFLLCLVLCVDVSLPEMTRPSCTLYMILPGICVIPVWPEL